MSQEKVDKRKYEKEHREQIERKRKLKHRLSIAGTIVVMLIIIGFPIGYHFYSIKAAEKKAANEAAISDFTEYLSTMETTGTEAATEAEDDSTTEAKDTTEDTKDTEEDTEKTTSEE